MSQVQILSSRFVLESLRGLVQLYYDCSTGRVVIHLEDYPSPAEGNGLENRQVAEMSRVGSNPTSSLGHTPYVKSRFLADLTTFDVYLSVPRRRAMLVRGSLKSLERKLFASSGNL